MRNQRNVYGQSITANQYGVNNFFGKRFIKQTYAHVTSQNSLEKELATDGEIRANTAAFGSRPLKINQTQASDNETNGVFSVRPSTNLNAIKAND